jgi:DNA/RNA endonuclease YhcR with UshA esterase domain
MKLLKMIGASRGMPGARLAGLLAVATIAMGCEDPDPVLELLGSGSVAGLVFFDADEDGIFDPSDGDMAVEGVRMVVRNRGTSDDLSNATATSGADGRFMIASLPLGTHDLLVDETTVPEGISVCQNPIPFSVFLNETSTADVRGRPGCLITIAEAKAAAIPSFVIVRGVVTSAPGEIESGWTYIQDESAGTKLFGGVLEGQGIEVGDRIEIGGDSELFSGDFDVTNLTLREVTADVGELQPELTTTAAIAASGATHTDPLQGLFIRVEAAELTAPFGTGNIQNALIDDGSGETIIRIDDGVTNRNTLNDMFSVGTCYDINGFGANFLGSGQIFPRSLADIVEVPCN